MKILIIGGTGFIGRALAAELLQAGHEPVIASRNPSKWKDRPGQTMEYIQWDGASPEMLSGQLQGIDGIVNLAGENLAGARWTRQYKNKIISSRTEVGKALTEAIRTAGHRPLFVLQGSATGYYGSKKYELMDETAQPGSGFLADLTRQWEASVRGLEQLGIRVVYLRTGLVLSTNEGILPKLTLSFKFGARVIPGSGDQWLPWIHIKDETAAIRFLAEKAGCKGPYNIVSPQPVTMRNLMKMISRYRKRFINLKIPPGLLRLVMGEKAEETILANQKIAPAKLLEDGFVFKFSNPNDALDDILK